MIDVTVTGLDELHADFARLQPVARKHVATAIDATGRAIVDGARERVPVLTGRLRAAIVARVVGNGADRLRTRIGISDPQAEQYATYVEFGTVHAPAQPFLHNAGAAERTRHDARLNESGRAIEAEMGDRP